MQSTHPNIEPSASSDKWLTRLSHYHNNLSALEKIYVNKLPYALLQNISEIIKQRWEQWEPYTFKFAGSKIITSAKDFILNVSNETSGVKLFQLIEIAKKTDSLAMTQCLTDCKNFVKERQQADQDHSKGFLDDISAETISELSKCISESSVDWRLLADGLGFDNLACLKLSTPKKMLEQWLQTNPTATVSRLHFEAAKIDMKSVCSFLNAIPIEGISRVVLLNNEMFKWDEPITLYEILRFEEILKDNGFTIQWDALVSKLLTGRYGINNLKSGGKDLISLSLEISRVDFFNALPSNANPTINRFRAEVDDGIFEIKSPGGITYSQICFLIKEWKILVDKNMTRKLRDCFFPGLRSFDIPGFISLYWQYPSLGGSLNLRDFYFRVTSILQTAANQACLSNYEPEQVFSKLKRSYDELKPWRSYDPMLTAKNIKIDESEMPKDAEAVVVKVESSSKPVIHNEDNNCKICIEREINAVIIPCGHLGYCLDCIKDLNQCPSCRGPIAQKIKIYKI